MNAEIINIGDEILIGQITNTNSVWLASRLNLLGVNVSRMTTVSDSRTAILNALKSAEEEAEIILITGGLGPTKDDITKVCLAQYFNTTLEMDEEVLKDVKEFFRIRGRELSLLNEEQALVPKGCKVLKNKNGTAPAMLFRKESKLFVSLPGVPYEMKAIMEEEVLPYIRDNFSLPFIYHKTILTQGIGESFLAELIEEWENSLADKKIKLAYLPQPGLVRLRLSSSGFISANEVEERIEEQIQKVIPLIDEYVYGFEIYGKESPTLEKITSDLLRIKGRTLAIAESCTGGYLSSLFTAIPGSSEIFKGSTVPYTNEAKHHLLQVNQQMFTEQGAVSEACVRALAESTIKAFKSDYALSVSGIAGPTGGTPEKPVGFVWIAVSNGKLTEAKSFQFGDNRTRNIQATANAAINMLRKFILVH